MNETKEVPRIGAETAEPDFIRTISDIQGGTLPAILSRAMAEAAGRVAAIGDAKSKGELTLRLVFTQSKGEDALKLEYQIKAEHPTMKGKRAEWVGDDCTVFCNRKGAVSAVPEKQGKFRFKDEG